METTMPYVDGFAIPVPKANREAYRKVAEQFWGPVTISQEFHARWFEAGFRNLRHEHQEQF